MERKKEKNDNKNKKRFCPKNKLRGKYKEKLGRKRRRQQKKTNRKVGGAFYNRGLRNENKTLKFYGSVTVGFVFNFYCKTVLIAQ